MARFLGIDWDHDKLYLVAASVNRGKVRIEKALALDQPHSLDQAAAEEFGKNLRERLKAAHIAPAPVVACLGRERVVFKEVRYPAVNAGEEAALVRFQVTKELAEPADRVVIDYTPQPSAGLGADRRATVSVARKPWLKTLETLCKAAHLKLAAVTPRPFGIAACLQHLNKVDAAHSTPAPEKGVSVAVVILTRTWGEFAVVRDGQVLFARPLPTGDTLMGEIRRNLTLYSNQRSNGNGQTAAIQALYFAGDEGHAEAQQRLTDVLAIPVHLFDPFGDQTSEVFETSEVLDRSGFIGAAGLVQQWALTEQAPINFIHPKQPVVKTSSNRLRYLLAAAAVVVLLCAGLVVGTVILGDKELELDQARGRLLQVEGELKRLEPEAKKVEQLHGWEKTAFAWADKFYELAERFPWEEGFRVNKVDISPLSGAAGEGKYTMRMNIKIVAPHDMEYLVRELVQNINHDKHSRAVVKHQKSSGGANSDLGEFMVEVDLADETQPIAETAAPVANFGSPAKSPGMQMKTIPMTRRN